MPRQASYSSARPDFLPARRKTAHPVKERGKASTLIDRVTPAGCSCAASRHRLFDAWFHSERATPVDPIDEYLGYAIAWLAGERSRFYDRESDEYVFVVDTDGGVWGQGEAYVPEDRYGDLTRDEFAAAILSSPGRARVVAKSRARVKTYCGACRYFGACPGFYVGDATAQQQQLLASDGCPMRAVMDHIVAALERAKLTDLVSRRGKPQAAALSINL